MMPRLIVPPVTVPVVSSFTARIEPEQAKQWLEHANTNNRKLRESVWERYAYDMIAGNWVLNGEAIVFDRNGSLVDGQHRLKACAESGVAFESLVVTGVEPGRAFDTIDSGDGRRTADAIREMPNACCIAAAAKLAYVHDNHGTSKAGNAHARPTRTQELAYIRANEPALLAAASLAQSHGKLCSPSVLAFCVYVFTRQNPEVAKRFTDDLIYGVNLAATNSVYHLRERLSANRASRSKLGTTHLIALFFRAWIAYRDGKQMRVLKGWKTDGPNPEQFPDIGDAEFRKKA